MNNFMPIVIRAYGLLKLLSFSVPDYDNPSVLLCPYCFKEKNEGHKEDCELNKILISYEKELDKMEEGGTNE